MESDLRIEYRPAGSLIPYINNARTHSDEQVGQIAASIREFGFTNPILLDGDNGIIAGHGRLSAANKLGMEQVPCIELKDLTEAQRKAYILADNRLAQNAGWDNDLLRLELDLLEHAGFDISLIGFNDADLAMLSTEGQEMDIDAEWAGMPEFSQEDKTAYQSIAVHFASEKDVQDFAKLIDQKISGRTRTVWFPNIEIERYADKAYKSNA